MARHIATHYFLLVGCVPHLQAPVQVCQSCFLWVALDSYILRVPAEWFSAPKVLLLSLLSEHGIYFSLSLLLSSCCLTDVMQHSKAVWTDPLLLPLHLKIDPFRSLFMWKLPEVVWMSRLCTSPSIQSNIPNDGTSTGTGRAL